MHCVQTSSFLFVGMWRVCISSKIQEVQGALSSRPKGVPGLLPIFQDFLLLSNHTPEIKDEMVRFCATSGRAHQTCILLAESLECVFESYLCPWAKHFTVLASLRPGVNIGVPVRVERVHDLLAGYQ